jgi:prophage regulatory protein
MAEQVRQFLRFKDVKNRVGLQRSSLYAKVKSGEFPAPIPLSEHGRAVAWDSRAIEAWMDSRIQAAGGAR